MLDISKIAKAAKEGEVATTEQSGDPVARVIHRAKQVSELTATLASIAASVLALREAYRTIKQRPAAPTQENG